MHKLGLVLVLGILSSCGSTLSTVEDSYFEPGATLITEHENLAFNKSCKITAYED